MSVTITKTSGAPSGDAPVLTQVISVTPDPQVKPEKPDANDVATIAILGAVCAVIAYGATRVIKGGLDNYWKSKEASKPWWYSSFIRLLCIGFGGAAGYFLQDSFGPAQMNFAIATGCGAGVLSTSIVAVVRKKIRGAA